MVDLATIMHLWIFFTLQRKIQTVNKEENEAILQQKVILV